MYQDHELAPVGSTGNNTHDALRVGGVYDALAVEFEVEAVGATPTVTWKVQGSADGTNWYDWGYITDASDTIATATRSMTAEGTQINFLANPVARKYKHIRVVTSANTNVTYSARAYTIT